VTNKQAVMHYSWHRLTASMTMLLPARTRQTMTNGLAILPGSAKTNV